MPIGKKRDLTVNDYSGIFKISPQLWEDLTTGENPFIKIVLKDLGYYTGKHKEYEINYTSHEGKKFQMGIYFFPFEIGAFTDQYGIGGDIYENTF
ncbi:hypothetical protein [Empedobacter tilapiae]